MTDTALLRLANSVIWPGFTGPIAPRWLLDALGHGLAGTVYFSHNLTPDDPAAIRRLSDTLHDANPESLIGVDEEGGIVTRLEAAAGSSVPGNAVLGRVDDIAATERVAGWLGRRVASAGIDIDLAPTVDVNSNPLNPVIGVRSFSADPSVVSRHAAATVRGIQDAGVAACAKHFPGHGDTTSDSHLEAALSDIDEETLHAVHLPPFAAAIEAGVKAIMCAHIRIPFLGRSPATINQAALAMAREMGFDGVMVTDALDMAAIRSTVGSGPGAVAALNAGADLLCTGNPFTNGAGPGTDETGSGAAAGTAADEREFREVQTAVYEALQSGELPVERVEQAAARIRDLAAWTSSARANGAASGLAGGVKPDSAEPGGAEPCGMELAARALEVTGDVGVSAPLLVIDARPQRTIAVGEAPDFFTAALRTTAGVDGVRRLGLSELGQNKQGRHAAAAPAVSGAGAAASGAGAAASEAGCDVAVLVSSPQTNPVEAAVLDAVLGARPRTVVVHTGWPGEARPAGAREVRTYGASRVGAEAVAGLLLARRP